MRGADSAVMTGFDRLSYQSRWLQVAPERKFLLWLLLMALAFTLPAWGQALTLAGSRYVLVEFDPGVSYRQLYQGVRKLIMARYVPVLAHVERYLCLRDEGNFRELVQCDCRMQMNYDSLAGPFWDPSVRWCRKKVEGGCIHLLATDMHRVDYRKPDLEKPMAWLQKHVGERRLRAMVWDNPLAIMKNERMG